MSLLEDVFLQDEAGEAQELERIIEGDEYDERPRDDANSDENSEKEDEAEEDKRRVDPSTTKTKNVVKNPRFVLNPARLTGPRGISVIPDHFKDFKFKGKGHEKEDLDLVLKKLEHWAYRLYPKFKFEDCLKKIEILGKKRPVTVHLTKIRSDQLVTEDTVVQKDSSDEEQLAAPLPPEEDEFDQLLQQQIELARATPGPGDRSAFSTPYVDKRSPFMVPKATSSPSISDEQRERMIRNRKLAEERRLARLKAATSENGNTVPSTNGNIDNNDSATNESVNGRDEIRSKKNRSNVIDSSDEEGELIINETVSVDIHISDKSIKVVNNKNDIDLTKSINNDVELVITGEPIKKNSDNEGDGEGITEVITLNIPDTDPKLIDLTEVQMPKNASNDVDLEINDVPSRKTNVLASDHEDKEINESVTLDLDAPNTDPKLIDLTGVSAKNKNVLLGDDNDDPSDPLITDPKLIDLTEIQVPKNASCDVDLEITGVSTKKKNNISVDENVKMDLVITGDQKFVDLTEGYKAQTSYNDNRRNNIVDITETDSHKDVVDSSDDDNNLVVSEAIIVDVHQNKTKNAEQINNKHVEGIQNKSNEANLNTIDDISNDDITDKESKDIIFSKNDQNNDVQTVDEIVKITKTSDAVSKYANTETILEMDKVEMDKNNSQEVDALDDLMDVDFNEDF